MIFMVSQMVRIDATIASSLTVTMSVHITLDDRKVWCADICPQSVGNGKLFFCHEPSPGTK
jgi:hypothetical protein